MLAAISEVVKSQEGSDTETEYFGALVSVLGKLFLNQVSSYTITAVFSL